MTVTYDTTLKTARMNADVTALNSGTLEIGTTGMAVVLASFTLNATSGTVASDVLTLSGFPKTSAATNGGRAVAARFKDSTTLARITGLLVGMTATAWAASTAYALNNIRANSAGVYRVTTAGTSAASGGPTGTGSAITDGGVVWEYLAAFAATAWAASTAYTVGNVRANRGSLYSVTTAGTSAASVGPTGTGSVIADGTAVWQYLAAAPDLTLDAVDITAGQNVTVSSVTITHALGEIMALLDEIKAKCSAAQLAALKTTNGAAEFAAVAATVSAGRVKLVETRIKHRHILAALGAEEGAAVIDALVAAAPTDGLTPARRKQRPLAYAAEMLKPTSVEGLDVADVQTRAQLDGLAAAGVMTAAQAVTLKALAERPDPVTAWDISNATRAADGSWLI